MIYHVHLSVPSLSLLPWWLSPHALFLVESLGCHAFPHDIFEVALLIELDDLRYNWIQAVFALRPFAGLFYIFVLRTALKASGYCDNLHSASVYFSDDDSIQENA
jgi:hypothetical protein